MGLDFAIFSPSCLLSGARAADSMYIVVLHQRSHHVDARPIYHGLATCSGVHLISSSFPGYRSYVFIILEPAERIVTCSQISRRS